MSDEAINELFYTFQKEIVSHITQREPTWEDIVARKAQAFMSQQAYNFEEGNYFNSNAGYFSQPHSNIPSYYHLGWGTYDNFSYGNPSMQGQESSSSYYQEQIRQPSFEEQFLALKEEIKKENDAREMRLPNIEPKVDANMIPDIDINLTNLGREMGDILDRMAIQVEELKNTIKEQSSR